MALIKYLTKYTDTLNIMGSWEHLSHIYIQFISQFVISTVKQFYAKFGAFLSHDKA